MNGLLLILASVLITGGVLAMLLYGVLRFWFKREWTMRLELLLSVGFIANNIGGVVLILCIVGRS